MCDQDTIQSKAKLWSNDHGINTRRILNMQFTFCAILTWKTHIKAKRCQLQLKLKNTSWLINARSQLSLDSKLTVYKAILRPIWTYGIELWGCSKPSNTKIPQTFQSKMLIMISSAPLYVSNQRRNPVRNGSGYNQRQQIQKSQHSAR
jgi:hypothetical protein